MSLSSPGWDFEHEQLIFVAVSWTGCDVAVLLLCSHHGSNLQMELVKVRFTGWPVAVEPSQASSLSDHKQDQTLIGEQGVSFDVGGNTPCLTAIRV